MITKSAPPSPFIATPQPLLLRAETWGWGPCEKCSTGFQNPWLTYGKGYEVGLCGSSQEHDPCHAHLQDLGISSRELPPADGSRPNTCSLDREMDKACQSHTVIQEGCREAFRPSWGHMWLRREERGVIGKIWVADITSPAACEMCDVMWPQCFMRVIGPQWEMVSSV